MLILFAEVVLYCIYCRANQRMDVNDLITYYFNLGFRHPKILEHLKADGVEISLKTLQRRLKVLNLWRKKNYSDIDELIHFIGKELGTSGKNLGYKWMWLRCILAGFVVKQRTVLDILHAVDPEGIENRKRKRLVRRMYHSSGTNFTWHVDGYCKLSPYGICISGAIDGFSR